MRSCGIDQQTAPAKPRPDSPRSVLRCCVSHDRPANRVFLKRTSVGRRVSGSSSAVRQGRRARRVRR